ncbi:hypothetical protein ACO0LM_27445 [Undibacterium sp. Di26W]|uniref:hypothetical protein n=1 Tax=Undibacterium sp. Di26W TaxID=3413035 RepID=UPI003BF2BC0E
MILPTSARTDVDTFKSEVLAPAVFITGLVTGFWSLMMVFSILFAIFGAFGLWATWVLFSAWLQLAKDEKKQDVDNFALVLLGGLSFFVSIPLLWYFLRLPPFKLYFDPNELNSNSVFFHLVEACFSYGILAILITKWHPKPIYSEDKSGTGYSGIRTFKYIVASLILLVGFQGLGQYRLAYVDDHTVSGLNRTAFEKSLFAQGVCNNNLLTG